MAPFVPARWTQPIATGRVIQVREAYVGDPAFSWARLLGLTLLVILAIFVGIWLAFLGLLLWLVFRWRPRLGEWWPMLLLGWHRERRTHAHQYFFLRCPDGRELTAAMSGRRLIGAIEPGHYVECWGHLRDGILIVQNGWNRTTNSRFGPA